MNNNNNKKLLGRLIDKISTRTLNIGLLLIIVIFGVGIFTGNIHIGSPDVQLLINAQNNQARELSNLAECLNKHTEMIARLITEMQHQQKSMDELEEDFDKLQEKFDNYIKENEKK